jgi:hypothetical protein
LLQAICRFVEANISKVAESTALLNKMSSQGESIERFVNNAFAATISVGDVLQRDEARRRAFSNRGNQTNPTDLSIFMLHLSSDRA